MSCYNDIGESKPGIGMPQPESESTRTRHLKECILKNSYKRRSQACATCRTILPSTSNSAPGEYQRILTKAVTCSDGTPRPIYRKPPYSSACTDIQTLSGDSFTFSSIAGIDNIAIPIRNIGSSENTSRKKVAIENSTSIPFFRKPQTPPVCIPTSQRVPYIPPYGQPGVPVAPAPPCILGNRRVDYSTGV
jgi:hypothetical protein